MLTPEFDSSPEALLPAFLPHELRERELPQLPGCFQSPTFSVNGDGGCLGESAGGGFQSQNFVGFSFESQEMVIAPPSVVVF